MRFHLAPALCVIALLSACSGAEFAPAGSGSPIGGQPEAEPSAEASTSSSTGNPPNSLPQSGQGNSGGVVSSNGEVAAGVEATMYYNSYRGRGAPMRSNGAGANFHNGDLTGVSVNCSRAGGGAVVPECEVSNAERAYLVNELSGTYAYAGAFAIEGHGPNGDQDSFVAIHSGPGMSEDERVQLPGDDVNYSGRFQAGAGVTRNGVKYEGRANGSVDLNADFNAGSLSGDFNGQIYDENRDTYVDIAASFEDAVIGPDGRFYNTEDTGFSYDGSQAWGELDGAFYGPNAEEAAGAFGFGNEKGGMTGILLGCSEHSGVNCVAPSPRF